MAQIYDSSHSGQEIDAAVDAVQTTIPSQLTQIGLNLGNLANLQTTDKSSLVAAINEVKNNANTTAQNTSYTDKYGIGATNVQDAIDNAAIVQGNYEEIDLTQYADERAYINADNQWSVNYSTYKAKFVPVSAGNSYRIYAQDASNTAYAFLKSKTYSNGTTPDYATGCTKVVVDIADISTDVAPSDATYMYVLSYSSSNKLPKKVEVQEVKSASEILSDIDTTPTQGSKNLITSGGVYDAVADAGTLIEKGREDGKLYINPVEKYNGKGINIDGTMFDASTTGAAVVKYAVEPNAKYILSGYSPADSNLTRASIVCEDANGVVLDHFKPCVSAGFTNFILTTKDDAAFVYIFENANQLSSVIRYEITFDTIKIDSIPQIYDTNKVVIEARDNLRVLCFGSSWFMNTWWYLNKLINAAGKSCEIHSYYMGHARMEEWIQLYNDDLTPFTSDSSRSASKNISVDGANYVVTSYASGGTYDGQAYRDDFYNDLISGNWDIIAFQQGAQECIVASEWDAKTELVSIVRSHCTYKTRIAFNATWTFGVKYSGSYFPTISRSEDGKYYFQQMNNQNTKLFMADTGILDVAPNGAMLSLMRKDASLNTTQYDMANDGLHPNNGLPMLGLCGCFFETFIAPMIGVSFDELNWLPTTSTQKCSVSGTYYNACTAEQLASIKQYVKKALANRFEYYR